MDYNEKKLQGAGYRLQDLVLDGITSCTMHHAPSTMQLAPIDTFIK